MQSLLIVAAGLMGAAGVILSAVAAHAPGGTGLASAANLLLFHAAAMPGAMALAGQGLLWRPAAIAAGIGWLIGAILFATDVAMRTYLGHRLFPMAAPTGGSILILAWLALTLAAIVTLARK